MARRVKYGNVLLFSILSTLKTGHFNDYFIESSKNLYLLILPLTTQPPKVRLVHYHNGRKKAEKTFFLYRGTNKALRYLFFYLYYLYILIRVVPRKTIVFATTPQYCIFWRFFKLMRSIVIVYHVGDYYPHEKSTIMKFYQWLIHFYNNKLPYVVYCSPLLESMLRTGKKKFDGNRNFWVFGIKKRSINKTPQNNLLGYIGVLRDNQGLEIIFDALKKDPKLKLEIMGDGPLLNNLKAQASTAGLNQRIKFLGLIQDEKKIIDIIKRWQIGLAPYNPNVQNMTVYGDPSKIKFYLEYKLPVIMTKITYLYKDIDKYHAGITINYTSDSLLKAISKIKSNYDTYMAGVENIINEYEYQRLYDKNFEFFKKIS